MHAIVALGNPGPEYETTRHNAGFIVADALAGTWHFPKFRRPWRWRARVAKGSVAGGEVVIVKPQTYMNRSGTALGPLLDRSDFDPATDLLVVVDDIALPMGSFRIRSKGSDGGHNGLKSIAGRLASDEYARLRIGVGPRPVGENQADFLLSPFDENELTTLRELVPTLIEAVDCWTRDGIELAMNRYNRRGTQSE